MKQKRDKARADRIGKAITAVRIIWWVIGTVIGIVIIAAIIAAGSAVGAEIRNIFGI